MRQLLILLGLACAVQLQAQDGTGVIKTNPWGWFAGQYQFGYEHFLSEKASVQVVPGAIFSTGTVSINDSIAGIFDSFGVTRAGFIVIPEFRYYLSDEAPDGVYIAAFGRYRTVTATADDEVESTRRRQIMGGGFVLGYQHQLANGLTGEVFIGPQFKSVNTIFSGVYEQYDDLDLGESEGTGIRFGVNIGFGF